MDRVSSTDRFHRDTAELRRNNVEGLHPVENKSRVNLAAAVTVKQLDPLEFRELISCDRSVHKHRNSKYRPKYWHHVDLADVLMPNAYSHLTSKHDYVYR